MNNKTKKIIAREGLVIIGIIVCSLSLYWLTELIRRLLATHFISCVKDADFNNPLEIAENAPDLSLFYRIENFTKIISLVSYPVYLLVRFVLLALRTLKQK